MSHDRRSAVRPVLGPMVLAASLLLPGAASQGDSRPRVDGVISLDEAVRIALRESPVIRGAVLETEAAVARWRAARAERRPAAALHSFAAGGSAANILDSSEAVRPAMAMIAPGREFFDQNVSLMVPLFTGGRLTAMVREADAMRRADETRLEVRRREVVLQVRLAFRESQARRGFVTVAEAALSQHRERLRVDRISFEQQRIPRFYVLRDEAEVALAEQELTNARRDVELAYIQLRTLMGIDPESRLQTADLPAESRVAASEPQTVPAGEDLPRVLAQARANRPELTEAQQRLVAGEARVAAARSAYRPQVGVGVMGDLMKMRGERLFGGATFGLTASLPLLDGGYRRAQVALGRAEAGRLEQEKAQVLLRVEQEAASALARLRAAETNLAAARVAVAAAREDYRIALLRYTEGAGINLEALDALAAQVRAENNEVQAAYERDAARDLLAYAAGTLLPPSLK